MPNDDYDIAIIGGAVASETARFGVKTQLAEKEKEPERGASIQRDGNLFEFQDRSGYFIQELK